MENTTQDHGSLQFDLYEDSILLMDEAQFTEGRKRITGTHGLQHSAEWAIMMLPTSGSIELEIAGESCTCGVGQVMVAMVNDGIVMKDLSPDFAARTIGMSHEFTRGLNLSETLSSGLAVQRRPIVDINDQIYQAIILIFEQLRGIIAAVDNPYRFRAVQSMVETYYYTIGYYLHKDADTVRRTGSEALADQFLQLARRDFRHHRDLDHYASALCISKKHLSATVAKVTGKPATHWIERNVILAAKQQLTHSPLTVAEIAADLHFANQSHFGTYFKRATGQSPESYRKGAKKGR